MVRQWFLAFFLFFILFFRSSSYFFGIYDQISFIFLAEINFNLRNDIVVSSQ